MFGANSAEDRKRQNKITKSSRRRSWAEWREVGLDRGQRFLLAHRDKERGNNQKRKIRKNPRRFEVIIYVVKDVHLLGSK